MDTGRCFWNLPEEISLDIFSRLPAKSVGICRCVCKPWLSLLFRPDFIKAHLLRIRYSHQQSLIFYYYEGSSLCCVSLSDAHQVLDKITLSQFKPILPGNRVSRFSNYLSCDGLLVVYGQGQQTIVLNPVTREIVQVPDSPFRLSVPGLCRNMEAFGYDLVDDDYKLVQVSHYTSLRVRGDILPGWDELVIAVYSLKTPSWKRAKTSLYYQSYKAIKYIPVFVQGCVFWAGCVVWLAQRTADDEYAIVAFSLVEQKFFEVPRSPSIDVLHCKLDVLGGCLCMFDSGAGDLWVMKEFGVKESWTKFTINRPVGSAEILRFYCWLGEEEAIINCRDGSGIYNLKQGSFKYFEFPCSAGPIGESFVESLVSPNSC